MRTVAYGGTYGSVLIVVCELEVLAHLGLLSSFPNVKGCQPQSASMPCKSGFKLVEVPRYVQSSFSIDDYSKCNSRVMPSLCLIERVIDTYLVLGGTGKEHVHNPHYYRDLNVS